MARYSTVKEIIVIRTIRGVLSQRRVHSFSLFPVKTPHTLVLS